MWTITNLRLKKDRRGVSNIIVVVLSLVIIVVIASNVVLWSYQMNQLDWEKMKEDVKITDVARVSSWFVTQSEYRINVGRRTSGTYKDTQVIDSSYEKFVEATSGAPSYHPSGYILGGSTSWVSGNVSDLTSGDGVYMTFRGYSSGTDTSDFVDNNIFDVDSSADKGTHSNFSAQQAGPDSIYDTLTEINTGEILVKKGTFTKATATGTQTINGIGFQPKAIIFWWTRQTSYGELAHIHVGYGIATDYGGSYQNYGVAFASDDAAATSNAGRRRSATYSIIILNSGTPVMVAQASVTAFGSDGFTLNWQTNENRADIIHYIALGGTGLTNAKAGTFSLTTGTGNLPIDTVGFQPNFVMFLWTFTEAVETNTAHGEIGLGFAVSSTQRGALVANSEDGRVTMDTWQQQRTDSCILLLTPSSGAQDAIVDFVSMDTSGFTLNIVDAPAASTPIFYLALQGGDYEVGSFNSPTSTGTHDITDVGFLPKAVMLATQGKAAATAIGSHAELAFGSATSSTERGCTWFEDPDNLADSDNEMETLNTRAIQWRDRTAANTFTLRGSADFVSFLSNGFRLNWTNVDTATRQVIYVAFGEVTNYELDLEVQWIDADSSRTNEELCIRTGTLNAENLKVEVWDESQWVTVISNLQPNSWNNVSVSLYLDSSTFTIRFKGDIETGDATQDNWNMDVTLLHVWSGEYTMEVEFVGSSNTEYWTELTWTIDSAWTTDLVSVTLQLYDYTLGDYPTRGGGYISYLTSSANIDENQSQTITQNPTHFRNATGYWKMKVKGVKAADTSFDFKADWVKFSPVVNYADYKLDSNGTFTIDLSTYPLAYIQTVEIQLRYMANDTEEKWYLKAYNWTDATYSDSGFNSTAGHMPTTGWDYYAVSLTDQWRSYVKDDGTMYIKFHDEETDNNQTTIDIDFLGARALFDGMLFVFKNKGAMTTHLVSLWVINSTSHERYDINLFINPGETLSYLSTDILLPDGQYTVKVVTERGNVAVYSGG